MIKEEHVLYFISTFRLKGWKKLNSYAFDVKQRCYSVLALNIHKQPLAT